MNAILSNTWLEVYPGEGAYLRVGATGRRIRTKEDLDKTVRGLEQVTESKEALTAFTMPHTFIRIIDGRVYISVYGVRSDSISRKEAVELLDQLKLMQEVASSPDGRELLGFEVAQ